MIGRFESIAQSLQVSIAQKAASFLAAEPPRSLFAHGLATQKIRVLDRTFQIEQVGQLVYIERHLSAIDVDQIWHGFKPGFSDESAEHI